MGWQLGSWATVTGTILTNYDEKHLGMVPLILGALLVLPVSWWIPESIRWVLNQRTPCVEVLEGRSMVDNLLEWSPPGTLAPPWAVLAPPNDVKRTTIEHTKHVLMQPDRLHLCILLCVLWFVHSFGSRLNLLQLESEKLQSSTKLQLAVIVHGSKFVGSVISVLVVDSIGRRKHMLICFLVSSITLVPVAAQSAGYQYDKFTFYATVVVLYCSCTQVWSTLTTYTVEALPTDMRNLGLGVLHGVGVFGVFVNNSFATSLFLLHPQLAFIANIFAFLAGAAIVTMLKVETTKHPMM